VYTTLAIGFTLGLSASVVCAGVCLPVLVPYVAAEHPTVRKGIYPTAFITGGRLAPYLILGLLAEAATSRRCRGTWGQAAPFAQSSLNNLAFLLLLAICATP
jgi:sulfite exporter TauE/SafE